MQPTTKKTVNEFKESFFFWEGNHATSIYMNFRTFKCCNNILWLTNQLVEHSEVTLLRMSPTPLVKAKVQHHGMIGTFSKDLHQ